MVTYSLVFVNTLSKNYQNFMLYLYRETKCRENGLYTLHNRIMDYLNPAMLHSGFSFCFR